MPIIIARKLSYIRIAVYRFYKIFKRLKDTNTLMVNYVVVSYKITNHRFTKLHLLGLLGLFIFWFRRF